MRILALTVLAALISVACGQRGPLYLRDHPPPGVTVRKADPYEPVPYPPDVEREREKQ